MHFWPDALVRDLVNRKVFVVLGAGVSKNSLSQDGQKRPPSWKEFLEAALGRIGGKKSRHIKRAIAEGDFLHACEWIKKRLDEEWRDFLLSQFQTPRFQPAEIHDLIFKLDQRLVATPNIDEIYDRHVSLLTDGQTRIKAFHEADAVCFLREQANYILKIHGTISTPGNIIFTQRDYAEKRITYSAFYKALDAAILSHTFLFIGCGVSDPDMNLLLENINFRFPSMPPHYFVTSSKIESDMSFSLRTNRNLKCLMYKPDNNHAALVEHLRELVDILDESRSKAVEA